MSDRLPPHDPAAMRYCESHEMHWVPGKGMSEKGASCPWCQRDVFWDELDAVADDFRAAVRSKTQKGGQQVSYHGSFCGATPSVVRDMEWYLRRWDEVLGRNVRRGV